MDELQKFKQNLEMLRNKRAVLEANISSSQAYAAKLRSRMEAMGYSSIAEAVEDYNRRVAGLPEKEAKVENLIHQIDTIDTMAPSREEILAKLRHSPSTNPTESTPLEATAILSEGQAEQDQPKVDSNGTAPIDMFPELKFNL